MSFTELFSTLVIRHKVMTMTEFYSADAFDLDLVASHMEEVDRDAAEMMRNIMWAMLAPNSKKKIAPEDIVKFSWEQPKSSGEVTTKEQFESIAKQFNLKTI